MSKTSRFTGKAGARFEDQGWRMRPIQIGDRESVKNK